MTSNIEKKPGLKRSGLIVTTSVGSKVKSWLSIVTSPIPLGEVSGGGVGNGFGDGEGVGDGGDWLGIGDGVVVGCGVGEGEGIGDSVKTAFIE